MYACTHACFMYVRIYIHRNMHTWHYITCIHVCIHISYQFVFCVYACVCMCFACMHVYACVLRVCMCTYEHDLPGNIFTYKADCVWVGRRRSRPKKKHRFEPFENCAFCVAQTWLNGIFPSPREFCGQLKRNQLYVHNRFPLMFAGLHTYTWYTWLNIFTYVYIHTYIHTYIYIYNRISTHVCILTYIYTQLYTSHIHNCTYLRTYMYIYI